MSLRLPKTTNTPKPKFETRDDDWETDVTYQNDSTEKSQRFGSSSVPGSGRVNHFDLGSVRDKVKVAETAIQTSYKETNPNRGYGGKFGTEKVMDKAAADFSYKADIPKHSSQTDGKKGFGGVYGVDERAQNDTKDDSNRKPQTSLLSKKSDESTESNTDSGAHESVDEKPKTAKKTFIQISTTSSEPKAAVKTPISAPTETPTTSSAPTNLGSVSKVSSLKDKFESLKKSNEPQKPVKFTDDRNKKTVTSPILKSASYSAEKPIIQEEVVTTKKDEVELPQVYVKSEQEVPIPPPVVENEPTITEIEAPTESLASAPQDQGHDEVDATDSSNKHSASLDSLETSDEGEYTLQPIDPNVVESETQSDVSSEIADGNQTKDNGAQCIVLYDYAKNDDEDLELVKDQIITDVEMPNADWWTGSIGTQRGMFPSNHVKLLT